MVSLLSLSGQAQGNTSSMVPVNTVSAIPKMCSCQLLELQLQNDTKQRIGVFAERDQTFRKRNGFHLMDAMIRKEKNYLQRGFADQVKVLNTYKSHTDCMTLYAYLKQQNKKFRMCDILNVDVLLSITGR
jgi:hypothetical protein